MKYELKRISVWSVIKISFLINLVLGFLVGIFYAFMLMLITMMPMYYMSDELGSGFPAALSGIMLIILPILMAGIMSVMNTILAAIATLVYNLSAKLVGGLEWELAQVTEKVAAPVVQAQAPPEGEPNPPETV